MNLNILEETYSIYRFNIGSVLPEWIYSSEFYSVTKTKDEISVVTSQTDSNPANCLSNRDWRIIKIEGPLDFSLVGIIADLSAILKKKNISIFTISTFDTDYIFVKQKDLSDGIKALIENGYIISDEN